MPWYRLCIMTFCNQHSMLVCWTPLKSKTTYICFAFTIQNHLMNTCIGIVIYSLRGHKVYWHSVQVKGQEGEGPKMVPKRQIQRKRKDSNSIVKETTEKLQVYLPSVHHPKLSFCIHVYLSIHLSRLKIGRLEGHRLAVSLRTMTHCPQLYNTAQTCCSVSTACLHLFRLRVVTQTATGSLRVWLQGQVKVTTQMISLYPYLCRLSQTLASEPCVSQLMVWDVALKSTKSFCVTIVVFRDRWQRELQTAASEIPFPRRNQDKDGILHHQERPAQEDARGAEQLQSASSAEPTRTATQKPAVRGPAEGEGRAGGRDWGPESSSSCGERCQEFS